MEKHCKSKHELAHIVRQFGKPLLRSGELSPKQIKVLYNILQCRTASLGGHEQVCKDCGVIHYSYNSCRDRHCPKCQGTKQALWTSAFALHCSGSRLFLVGEMAPYRQI